MRGFNNNEYEKRVLKTQKLMDKNNIDILLITSPQNFRYYTGLNSYFWESPTRPWFLLISNNSEPIAIIPSIGETSMKNTWIKNIKTWKSPNPEDEGITALTNVILSIKKTHSKIGCEMGKENFLRMVINDFNKFLFSLKSLPCNTILSSNSINSWGKSAAMKAFTVVETWSGSLVSGKAVCTT